MNYKGFPALLRLKKWVFWPTKVRCFQVVDFSKSYGMRLNNSFEPSKKNGFPRIPGTFSVKKTDILTLNSLILVLKGLMGSDKRYFSLLWYKTT